MGNPQLFLFPEKIGGVTVPPLWFPVAIPLAAGALAYIGGAALGEVVRVTCDSVEQACAAMQSQPGTAHLVGQALGGVVAGVSLPIAVFLHAGLASAAADLAGLMYSFTGSPSLQPPLPAVPTQAAPVGSPLQPGFIPMPSVSGGNQARQSATRPAAAGVVKPDEAAWWQTLTATEWVALVGAIEQGSTIPFNSLEQKGFTRGRVKALRDHLVRAGVAYEENNLVKVGPAGKHWIRRVAQMRGFA